MLIDQLQKKESLTPQEGLVADYILEHLKDIGTYSASGLAQSSFTSKGTVVRLAQKLGCSGFKELRTKLIVEGHQKQHFAHILAQEPITSASRFKDLIEVLPGIYDKALTNTNLTLSKQSINRVATSMQQADSIEIYGTGIAFHLGQTASFKLATLGKEVSVYESLNHHFLTYRKPAKRVALLLTFTGNNPHIRDIAKLLREQTDTYLVALAGPYQDDLSPYCHEVIEIYNRDSLSSLDVITSFTSCNYILDLLFSLLLTKQYDKHLEQTLKEFDSLQSR